MGITAWGDRGLIIEYESAVLLLDEQLETVLQVELPAMDGVLHAAQICETEATGNHATNRERNWLHTMSGTLGAEVTFGVVASDREARSREISARKARRRARRDR